MRIGHGYDIHPFTHGRALVLGGVTIPYIMGLHGHSDADALTHAICDAILGAAGLGDIGVQFPDDDPHYEGIHSILLLQRVVDLVGEKGWKIENVDATVIAEKPKIQPHVADMRAAIEPVLRRTGGAGQIGIKATTNEGLGSLGRGEGLAAHAVALLLKR